MSEINEQGPVLSSSAPAVRLRRKPEPISADGFRKCYGCQENKPIAEFRKRKSGAWEGITGLCEMCSRKSDCVKTSRYQKANPGKQMERYYGLTLDKYNRMLLEQNGGCAICGEKQNSKHSKRLFVDHNHTTRKVRGLLCHLCNIGIGGFKDDANRLRLAISYLEKTK